MADSGNRDFDRWWDCLFSGKKATKLHVWASEPRNYPSIIIAAVSYIMAVSTLGNY